jgi:hypothetical protein
VERELADAKAEFAGLPEKQKEDHRADKGDFSDIYIDSLVLREGKERSNISFGEWKEFASKPKFRGGLESPKLLERIGTFGDLEKSV